MNVIGSDDFELAKEMQRAISLGASPKDLVALYPDFFCGNERQNQSKSKRVFEDLKPADLEYGSKKNPSIISILKDRTIKKNSSNFAKYAVSVLNSVRDSDSLTHIFYDTFDSWKKISEDDALTFQVACQIWLYLVSETIVQSYFESPFIECETCNSSFLAVAYAKDNSFERCPYCNSKQKKVRTRH